MAPGSPEADELDANVALKPHEHTYEQLRRAFSLNWEESLPGLNGKKYGGRKF